MISMLNNFSSTYDLNKILFYYKSTGKVLIPEMCEPVIDNFQKRPDVIIAKKKGRHIDVNL